MSLLRDARAVIVTRFALEDSLRRSPLGGQIATLELGLTGQPGSRGDGTQHRLAECYLAMRDLDALTLEILRLRYYSCLGPLRSVVRLVRYDSHLEADDTVATMPNAEGLQEVYAPRRCCASWETIAALVGLTPRQCESRCSRAIADIQGRMDGWREEE